MTRAVLQKGEVKASGVVGAQKLKVPDGSVHGTLHVLLAISKSHAGNQHKSLSPLKSRI